MPPRHPTSQTELYSWNSEGQVLLGLTRLFQSIRTTGVAVQWLARPSLDSSGWRDFHFNVRAGSVHNHGKLSWTEPSCCRFVGCLGAPCFRFRTGLLIPWVSAEKQVPKGLHTPLRWTKSTKITSCKPLLEINISEYNDKPTNLTITNVS